MLYLASFVLLIYSLSFSFRLADISAYSLSFFSTISFLLAAISSSYSFALAFSSSSAALSLFSSSSFAFYSRIFYVLASLVFWASSSILFRAFSTTSSKETSCFDRSFDRISKCVELSSKPLSSFSRAAICASISLVSSCIFLLSLSTD